MTTAPELDHSTALFEEHRGYLFGVAYRMLGVAAEAEDIVQDAYLRFRSVAPQEVRNARSFLATIVTRLCLDHLKSARVQREQYIGPWLPEPIVTSEADWRIAPEGLVDLRDSVSMAFLVMLERLRPVERAVLLLHDVFDYSHAEVARMVGKSEPASRQLLKRAHDHLGDQRPRYTPSLDEQRRLTEQFMSAAATGDVSSIMGLLADDVVVYSDGGGKVGAALNPVVGAHRVARFIIGARRKEQNDAAQLIEINGRLGTLAWKGKILTNVFSLDIEDGRIVRLLVQRNPEKLRRLGLMLRTNDEPRFLLEDAKQAP